MKTLAVLLFALALTGCASRTDGGWQDDVWVRTGEGPGALDADREACMAEVAMGSGTTRTDRMTALNQSLFNRLYRRDHMRVCMRDKGWTAKDAGP